VARYSGSRKFITMGVLSLPRSMLAQWLAVFRGRAELIAGYAVEALPAIGILAKASPEAAAWWRENTPHLDRAKTLSRLPRGSLPHRRYLIRLAMAPASA
jgi:hypothetical protein